MTCTWWQFSLMTIAAASAHFVLAPARLLADPPGRVARLSYLRGAVSLRPAGSDEWAAAGPNRPLTMGDRVWTDTSSRAELHVGSTAIRINSQTELDFTALDDNTLQARLAQGSVTIRVRHLDNGQVYEIDTPNGAISIGRAGEYRIDVSPDGMTSVVDVWTGSSEVTSAGSSFAVNDHQQATIRGTNTPTYDLVDAPAYDQWDQWCVERDHREDNSQSARYVSTEMTGYEDLDAYGRWEVVPEYGNVWVPAGMGPGWAPYHTGHWIWVDPWGWTCVDDAPWGYAPYHYGRWVFVGAGWAWVPGRVVARPVYAPALVAFVGAPGPRPGASVGVAFGGGAAVAWFALGPEEVYHPGYAVSPGYVRQVNVTNVTNVTNITNVTNVTNVNNVTYRNREVPGAMMATSSATFASARPVQSTPIAVNDRIRTAPVMSAAPAIAPTRASLAPAVTERGAIYAPPSALANRPVMAKLAPPPAPIPFAAKQQALAVNGGRPLAPAQEAQIRASSPGLTATNAALVKPATIASNGVGLRAAHAGLPAAKQASAVPSGFVARPSTPSGQMAVRVAQPTGTTAASATVAQPQSRPSVTVAVPHRVINTNTVGSTTIATPAHAASGTNGPPPPPKVVKAKKGGQGGGSQGGGKGGAKPSGDESGKGDKHPSNRDENRAR
jgi:hypothetical protein